MPPDVKIDLFIDSQAAINGIKKSLTTPITPRFWLKANNDSIISNIKHRISTLHLTVKLHKIKGHSGNEYNDKADVLAKPVHVLKVSEAGCLSAAMLACGAHTGADVNKLMENWIKTIAVIEPDKEKVSIYNSKYISYKELYPVLKTLKQ